MQAGGNLRLFPVIPAKAGIQRRGQDQPDLKHRLDPAVEPRDDRPQRGNLRLFPVIPAKAGIQRRGQDRTDLKHRMDPAVEPKDDRPVGQSSFGNLRLNQYSESSNQGLDVTEFDLYQLGFPRGGIASILYLNVARGDNNACW